MEKTHKAVYTNHITKYIIENTQNISKKYDCAVSLTV